MTDAFVVTQGSYSDYHIVAVFLDRTLAEQCVASYPVDDYDTPEIEVWPIGSTPIVWRTDLVYYFAWVNKPGADDSMTIVSDWWTGRPKVESWGPSDSYQGFRVTAETVEEARHAFGEAKAAWQREQT